MSTPFCCDITVLGGFPVRADAWIADADPSVGISDPYIEEIVLRHYRTGKPLGAWIDKRIAATKGEQERIDEQIWSAIRATLEEH